MIKGFFQTRSETRVGQKSSKTARVIGSWRDINPAARHPDMPTTGAKHPSLYILGEAPGETEDARGEQFIGDSGKRLRALIPKQLQDRIRWDNTCRTRPPKNRTPDTAEVEYYRAAVTADIDLAWPKVLMCVGNSAVNWALPGVGSIKLLRGRKFPLKIGRREVWVFPVHHPAWILRVENGKEDDIPGAEWREIWERDVSAACQAAMDENYPRPHVQPSDEDRLVGGCKWPQERGQILRALKDFHGKDCAFDFETSRLRPYEANAKLLCVGIGSEMQAISFPWSDDLREPFLAWLRSGGARIAHNAAFELEWIASVFGAGVLHEVRDWHDTQAQGYCLDERKGGHSLDFLCRLHFGLALKSQSAINRANLKRESIEPLLRYNSLDAKFTWPLWREQVLQLRDQGLEAIYEEHRERVPTAVLTQHRGLAVDPARVDHFQQKLGSDINVARTKISLLSGIDDYRKRHGKFNPGSPQDVLNLLKGLGFDRQLQVGPGKYSTDDSVLSKIQHPVAEQILGLRKLQKLKGTYVDRLQANHRDTYLFADGRLHPQFNTLMTITGRWSSDSPNAQNFPMRKHAEIRSQIVADHGCVFLACDYGQLEARVIASLSGQFEIVQQDVHMHWAERIAKLNPAVYKKRGSDIEAFRSDIKNQLVFPLFYGTSAGHVGAMLELPRRTAEEVYAEFWQQFPKVRKWQRKLLDEYKQLGYVESPTGRRRHAPMKNNEIINTPVQGAASDIVVAAMNALSLRAFTEERPRLQPVLNIHDDITLCVPRKKADLYGEALLAETLRPRYSWLLVPLQVKLSAGPNWFELEPIGKYDNVEEQ